MPTPSPAADSDSIRRIGSQEETATEIRGLKTPQTGDNRPASSDWTLDTWLMECEVFPQKMNTMK